MAGQADSFFGNLFANTANFKDNTAGFYNCYPVVNGTLTTTHTGFGWLGSNRLVREDTYPHFTTALHKAGESDTSSFDLTSLHPTRFQSLQAKITKREGIPSHCLAFHAPT